MRIFLKKSFYCFIENLNQNKWVVWNKCNALLFCFIVKAKNYFWLLHVRVYQYICSLYWYFTRPTGTFPHSQYTICCWSFLRSSLPGPEMLKLKYWFSGWTYRQQLWLGETREIIVIILCFSAAQHRPSHSTEEPEQLIKSITRAAYPKSTFNCENISVDKC